MKAHAVSVPGEHEVLLSDKLLDALGIEIARAGMGYWSSAAKAQSASGGASRPSSR